MAHLLFAIICVIWGSGFLFMKKANACFGQFDIAAIRVVLAAGALFPLWALRRQPWPFDRNDLAPLLLVAVVGYAVPFWIQPYVIVRTGSAFAGMLLSLVPLLTIAASVPLLGVYPSVRQLVGVGGGLMLMGVLMAGELSTDVRMGDLILAAITPCAYATANTYVKRRFNGVPPLALTMTAMGLTAAMLIPISLTTEPIHVNEHLRTAMLALLALGVLGTGLATFFFYTLIQRRGPLYAAMVAYIIPCVAVTLGWLDNETIPLSHILVLAGILAMVALVQTERTKIDG